MSLLRSPFKRRIITSSWASTSSLSRTRVLAILLPLSSSSLSSSSSPRSTSFHSTRRTYFHSSPRSLEENLPPTQTPIGQIQRRLQITFTCTAPVPLSEPVQAQPEAQVQAKAQLLATETKFGVCSHRSSHEFSRQAYEKGLVLIECPACKNRHLIGEQSIHTRLELGALTILIRLAIPFKPPADHLEWFSTTPSAAHPDGMGFNSESGAKRSRTIEDLMREKGEEVKWLKGGSQGDTWTVEG
ncbi:BQ2448_8017 [Microbotryum intermedium]|uniref:BQ2448_8017 protein n=1 Tax=Microbotryum intermedium TaxID=269621 RepID=A0A238FUU6_9BASI|nr:BQ2448_8017 [Microbotryum intermedium]